MKTKDLIAFGRFVLFAVLSAVALGAVIANPAALGGLFAKLFAKWLGS